MASSSAPAPKPPRDARRCSAAEGVCEPGRGLTRARPAFRLLRLLSVLFARVAPCAAQLEASRILPVGPVLAGAPRVVSTLPPPPVFPLLADVTAVETRGPGSEISFHVAKACLVSRAYPEPAGHREPAVYGYHGFLGRISMPFLLVISGKVRQTTLSPHPHQHRLEV